MDNNYEIEIFCSKVRKLRQMSKMSKKEMAEIMGISVYILTKIESGVLPESVDVSSLLKLCEKFDVRPSSMFLE